MNGMKKVLVMLVVFCFAKDGQAQFTRYIVRFSDKAGTPFSISNPGAFLTQRAIDRRNRYQIPIDSTDLPVTPRYLDSIRLAGNVTILNISKWLNQVSIETSDPAALAKINSFPFVISANPAASRSSLQPVNKTMEVSLSPVLRNHTETQSLQNYFNYGASYAQVKIHNGQFLHNHGFRGEGMQIAVLDAGFYRYDALPTFDSMLLNNRLLGTWDFVANETSVAEDNSHGMNCLSTIAADMPGTFIGTAPKSSFYLYRTEDVSSEYPIEEHNFASGAERADSLGVDVCSTSLGYYLFDNPQFNYSYNDMDGNTTISAKASDWAAKKGMLMVFAAGNEGNGSWRYLITPSDADSVFAVGAVDSLGNVAGFSSYGPSSDGQIKPSVAAVGRNAIVANTFDGMPAYSNGTSFACPNMAGITTCLWQAFPEFNNMAIMNALQQSGNLANNPDDRIGYGIPDAKHAFVQLQRLLSQTNANFSQCKANLQIQLKADSSMHVDVERKFPGETDFGFVTALNFATAFSMQTIEYSDDLAGFDYPSVQYRYKVRISNDTSYYLDPLTVNYTNPCNINPVLENAILITPNPVTDFLNVRVSRTSAAKVGIVVFNAAGQKVYANQYQQPGGVQNIRVSMQQMQAGTYFITVYLDDQKAVTKKLIRP